MAEWQRHCCAYPRPSCRRQRRTFHRCHLRSEQQCNGAVQCCDAGHVARPFFSRKVRHKKMTIFSRLLTPSMPILLPPQFTSLLITDAPLASFVLINFCGLAGTAATSATRIMGSVSQSLVVTGYESDGNFGTVTVQFSHNIRVAGSAQVIIKTLCSLT